MTQLSPYLTFSSGLISLDTQAALTGSHKTSRALQSLGSSAFKRGLCFSPVWAGGELQCLTWAGSRAEGGRASVLGL